MAELGTSNKKKGKEETGGEDVSVVEEMGKTGKGKTLCIGPTRCGIFSSLIDLKFGMFGFNQLDPQVVLFKISFTTSSACLLGTGA